MRILIRPGTTLAMLGLTGCLVYAQGEISAGEWSATIGATGPTTIMYAGELITTHGRFAGYRPAWKGDRFSMQGAQLTTTASTATWQKSMPGNQEATLTLELTPEACRFSLDTTISAAGPSEMALQIIPQAVRTAEDRCFLWLNGKARELNLTDTFDRIGGIKQMRFEQPERTVTITCEGFEMQDRRTTKSGLFLVQVIGSTGLEPRQVRRTIDLKVEPAPPQTVSAREQMLAQRVVEQTNVPFDSSGFEGQKPLSSWSSNPKAALDTETKHSGAQAARIEVSHEDDDPYLIQLVPVKGRMFYQAEAWIKAENAEAATIGGRSATGATIIIEFSDKQGNWLAPGAYAKGLYGTKDWTRLRTGIVQAPAEAGYANIYLSLRALGKAWFDDVILKETHRNLIMLSPLPRQALRDNTPSFSWYSDQQVRPVLQVCPDPKFTPDHTVSQEAADGVSASLERPIAPGDWYWRLSVPDWDYISPAWQFAQTARLDEDTTEPKLVCQHAYLTTATAPATAHFSDNVGVDKVSIIADGVDVTGQVQLTDGTLSYAPAAGWDKGLHKLSVRVQDAAGNTTEKMLFLTHTDPMPKTAWQQAGGVSTDGEMHFRLGMYGILAEHMPAMAEGGFDFVHNYTWDGAGTNDSAIEYMDEAQRHGLQAFIGFERKRLIEGDDEFVADRVGALMSHPGLFAWYLFDEPDLPQQYVPPTSLARYYRLIKALDPFHPVVVTCAHDGAVAEYKDALDVHWTQVYGGTSFVARRLPKHRADLNPGTPLMAILHCYDRPQTGMTQAGKQADPAKFQPDGRLMRANAFLAITKNTSGMAWWWWGQGSDRYFTVANAPEAWQSLQQTVADIKTLEPVLTAPGQVRAWTQEPAEGTQVHLWEKQLPGRVVILAVNEAAEPCSVEIAPQGIPGDCTMQVLFEDRTVRVADGLLSDQFEPIGVHVYEYMAPGK